jgi:hypothetical protein
MSDTRVGQPYDMLGHDVQFWRKCLKEGMGAEFAQSDLTMWGLDTRAKQDAQAQLKLTEAINDRAAIADLIDLCEACEANAKSNFNVPELLKAHADH